MPPRGVAKAKAQRLTRQGPRGRRPGLGLGATGSAAAPTATRARPNSSPPLQPLHPPQRSAARRDSEEAASASRATTPQWHSTMRLPSEASRFLPPSTTELDCIDYLNLSSEDSRHLSGLICALRACSVIIMMAPLAASQPPVLRLMAPPCVAQLKAVSLGPPGDFSPCVESQIEPLSDGLRAISPLWPGMRLGSPSPPTDGLLSEGALSCGGP